MAKQLTGNDQDKAKLQGNVTASVERALEELAPISSYCPKNTYVIENQVMLSWVPLPEVKTYKVSIMNFGEEILHEITTDKPYISSDLTPFFKKEKNILWVVADAADEDKKSKVHFVKPLDDKNIASIQSELRDLKEEVGTQDAVSKLVLASFFEKKMAYIESTNSFKEVVLLAPDVEEYKTAFHEYLKRSGMGSCAKP